MRPDYCGTLGAPCGTMRAAGGTHDGLEAYFHNRFWCHFGPPFCKSLLAQRIQNLVFFSPVPRWFFGTFFESKFRHLGCSCGRYCKRHVFAEVGIVRFRGGICFVFRVLGSVFMAFGALDAGLNFSDFHGCSWGGRHIQSILPGRDDFVAKCWVQTSFPPTE